MAARKGQIHFDEAGPRFTIVVPNPDALKGLPTERTSGGPFLMFAGTPYAHMMVRVTA